MDSRDWLVLSIFTFVTVMVWIASDVYHAVVTSQITDVQQELIAPLDPKISQAAIDNILGRK